MIERLRSYSWPGNVRELKNVIWRVFIMSDGQIDGDLMPDPAATPTPARKSDGQGRVCCAVGTSLADAEYRLIMATLKHCGENKKKTAAALGISLKTLYNRLTEYSGKAPTRSPAAVTADESN
jgi:DNA-binding NtrC family response regulator